jgi:hypothetical protein
MAKKSPRKASKSTVKSAGRKFSIVGLHNKLDETLARLRSEKRTKKRDELIGLVQKLRSETPCPQIMLIDLEV